MKKFFKENKKKIFLSVIIFLLIFILFMVDLKWIFRSDKIKIFRENIFYLTNLFEKFKYIFVGIILIYVYLIISKKWVFRIEKMSYGGITFQLNKPDKMLKQSISNYLNTKRTLFKINPQKDNFYDTINSYYSVYELIRNEISPYDTSCSKEGTYETCNNMIRTLNKFLTSYQSDYKRWYEYLIENNKGSIYDKDIEEIQKKYRKYDEILAGFNEVNNDFIKYAEQLGIDSGKWNDC